MITIIVSDRGAVARVEAIALETGRPVALAKVLGREVANILRKHFLTKQANEPNKLGGKRTNFWREVSKTVNQPEIASDGSSIRVAVSHPLISHKYTGGTIRPKRVKMLTIPVDAESYGKTAATLEHEKGIKLFILRQDNSATLAYAQDDRVKVMYVLRASVNQAPDPTALPEEKTITAAVLARAEAWRDRQIARANGNAS